MMRVINLRAAGLRVCAPVLTFIVMILGIQKMDGSENEIPESLKNVVANVSAFMESGKIAELDSDDITELKSITSSAIDYEKLGYRALGRYKNLFSEEELDIYLDLFPKLLVRSYAESYSGDTVPEIDWQTVRSIGENKQEVVSSVKMGDNQYEVIYRMNRESDGEWRAYDIIAEGISLVSNYREQFASILQRDKPSKLIEMLQKKVK